MWEQANNDDHWLRHIIEGGAVRSKAPRLKEKYIENKLDFVIERPWEAEISGRLLSKAMDIRERADAAAAHSASLKFRQIAYVAVQKVRQDTNLDVYFEPNEDPAHANLVVLKVPLAPPLSPPVPDNSSANPVKKIAHEFVKNLAAMFLVCDANDLAPLEALRAPSACGLTAGPAQS